MRGSKSGLSVILAVILAAGAAGGVAAQEATTDPTAPVEFTGKTAFGGCIGEELRESQDGRIRSLSADNGRYCRASIVEAFSDPRLRGDHYVWQNHDRHIGGPMLWHTAFSIVDDAGAWRGVPTISTDDTQTVILDGEGAYEGLTIVATVPLEGTTWNWHGWIIEGDLPPLPTEPEAIP